MSSTKSDYAHFLLPTYHPVKPVFVRGSGSRLWDEKGGEYIDFGGGIAVLPLGHCPPKLTKAISHQAQQLMHVSNWCVNQAAVDLAKRLVTETFAEKVFLSNSGAEANEAALKIARRYGVNINPQKYKVLAFENGFHGRVGLGMVATKKINQNFGPLAPGFVFSPYNDIAAATEKMNAHFCAIIVEPIQGEGGIQVGEKAFLEHLRALSQQFNAFLIFDEIQTGIGRVGELFAYMEMGVTPDILTSAKGLGNGFPVAATLVGEKGSTVLGVGDHGSTYGGNPLASKAANVVLEMILDDSILNGVKVRSDLFFEQLTAIGKTGSYFKSIRGKGLLVGAELLPCFDAKTVVDAALEKGLFLLTAQQNTLRFAPALNIDLIDIEEGFDRLRQALCSLSV